MIKVIYLQIIKVINLIIIPEKKEKSTKDNEETIEIQLNSDTKKEEQITYNKTTNNIKFPKNVNSLFKKENQQIILKKLIMKKYII